MKLIFFDLCNWLMQFICKVSPSLHYSQTGKQERENELIVYYHHVVLVNATRNMINEVQRNDDCDFLFSFMFASCYLCFEFWVLTFGMVSWRLSHFQYRIYDFIWFFLFVSLFKEGNIIKTLEWVYITHL